MKTIRIVPLCLSIAIVLVTLMARSAVAASYTLLLWYPGAEGSPEQAAPLLETWTDYLTRKGLSARLKPVYQNAPLSEGRAALQKLQPAVAIVSLDVYLHLSQEHPLTLLAQTRKLPAGDGSMHYTVLKNQSQTAPTVLFMSEPLTEAFARNIVLRNSPDLRQLSLQYVPQVLQTLKKVGRNEVSGAVLVNAYEDAVLKRLKSPWSTPLLRVTESPRLPAPPLVLFDSWRKDFPAEQFVALLIGMENDPEGQEILQELRMKGFMPPKSQDYEALRRSLAAP